MLGAKSDGELAVGLRACKHLILVKRVLEVAEKNRVKFSLQMWRPK